MRIAVIGAGRMGAIRVEDLAADPRVTQILIANRTQPRAAELAERFGAQTLPWDGLGSADVDAWIVAVGTDMHTALLTELLPRGHLGAQSVEDEGHRLRRG